MNTIQPITHHVTISELATSLIDSCAALISSTPPSLQQHAGCDHKPPESSLFLRATSLRVGLEVFYILLLRKGVRHSSVVAGCFERWLPPLRSLRAPIRPLENPPPLLKRSTNASIAIELSVGVSIAAGMKDRVSLINFCDGKLRRGAEYTSPAATLKNSIPIQIP